LSILQFVLVLLPTVVVRLDTKNPFFQALYSGQEPQNLKILRFRVNREHVTRAATIE